MKERLKIKGSVTVRVLDENGQICRRPSGYFRRLLGLKGRLQEQIHHNVVTDQGDALIADLLSQTPTQTKVDNTAGHIEVGTGWTGLSPKSNSGCNTFTGSHRVMDAGYPQTKGSFGNTDDNVVVYRTSFPVGSLTANGIDEAALMNAAVGGVCLAYAQITPEINVTSNDTLQIEWELSFLGS